MITRKQFIKFCNNHKINYDKNGVYSSNYCVYYQDAEDPNLDKSLEKPSNAFIHISFTDKESNDTYYLYKPFQKVYDSDKSDNDVYTYTSYGDFYIPEPIYCYLNYQLAELFNTKKIPNHVIKTNIPFNTLDQLEHLYSKYNQFAKDVKDFYSDDSFQQAAQTYKNNRKMAEELKLANENLIEKTLQIAKRKHDLSEDFIKSS